MGVYSLVIKGISRRTLKRMDQDFDAVIVRAKFGNGKVSGVYCLRENAWN